MPSSILSARRGPSKADINLKRQVDEGAWIKCPRDGVHYRVKEGYCKEDTVYRCNKRGVIERVRLPQKEWKYNKTRWSPRLLFGSPYSYNVCRARVLYPWTQLVEEEYVFEIQKY